MSELPPRASVSELTITVHSVSNPAMWSYTHTPFANYATHVHWYVWNDTSDSTADSVHVAPFAHGLLAHSSTSMSQLPPTDEFSELSITLHSVAYSVM